jgi:23S rRNA (uracil1939-C5)-methyltransferase
VNCMNNSTNQYQVTFEDMTHDARGVCKIDGFPIFVEGVLRGETAHIEITKRLKNYGFGRVIHRLSDSPFRVEPTCEHYATCGGCNLMHMNYAMQQSFKTSKTLNALRRMGQVNAPVLPIKEMLHPYAYRNKAMFHFSKVEGRVVAGYYEAKSNKVVSIRRCHILPKVFSEILNQCRRLVEDLNISVYDPESKKGLLKGLLIRESKTSKEVLVTFVTTSNPFRQKDFVVKKLKEEFPNIVGIMQNFQEHDVSHLGQHTNVLYGTDSLTETVDAFDYQLSSKSFFQVNISQAETMLQMVKKAAKLTGKEVVVDAYAGVGHIGFALAKKAKKVILIESESQAVADGKKAAKKHQLSHVKFIEGQAEVVIKDISEEVDVLVVDPPRKGLDPVFIESVIAKKVKKVIYVSCDVSTLARDLKLFENGGYQTVSTTPLDMFPHTTHIESVTVLNINSA